MHTYVEAAAASYDGRDVLRISECLELIYDATARCNDTPSRCADCDFGGCLYRLTGAYEIRICPLVNFGRGISNGYSAY